MANQRRRLFYLLPLLGGAALALVWVQVTGGAGLISGFRQASPSIVVGMLGITAIWLLTRFVRWQFLLRRAGVRVPIRPSLASYLAAVPGTVTPAYIGEIARGIFIRRRFGVPVRLTTAVLVLERLYDVGALGVISIATAGDNDALALGVIFVALPFVVALVLWPLGQRAGLDASVMKPLRAPTTVLATLAISLVAWAIAALLIGMSASAVGVPLGLTAGANIFASSTLVGALTLLPAGVGATGSVAILQLQALGVTLSSAVIIVSLVRLTSTGAAITVGSVFFWRELAGAPSTPRDVAHFDTIADEYRIQWSSHVWDHLLTRKMNLIASAIPAPEDAGLGLDLGCGLGVQMEALIERGFRIVGLEPSFQLLSAGRSRPRAVLAGDACALPFRNATFDFVYAVGVLHHLPGREAQQRAYREVMRILKPGGVFLVHESNPRNPLFRFYMGYVFPILKSIDEGTEWWVDPNQPEAPAGLHVEAVHYFTFLPDFTPRALMAPALAIERNLERRAVGKYSAHYMAALRREM